MRRLPWALWLVVVAIGIAISPSALGDGAGPFAAYFAFVLAFATVGALVSSRRPENPIGWILLGAGLAYVIGGVSVGLSESGGRGDWHTLAAWTGDWVWTLGIGPVGTFGLLLFPTGCLPSRRWRPVAWLAGAAIAAAVLGLAFAPGPLDPQPVDNPVGFELLPWLPGALATAGAVALIGALLASIASLRARYRGAAAEERQQLKWLLYAAALVGASVATMVPLELAVGSAVTDLSNTVATLSLATVPVAMGIAILRHRLFDIDLVIRRTLVYGVLTATLGASYLGCVLLAQLVIGAESDLAVAVSTLAVAALFRPALARIQGLVDRRFYRRRYDAARTLEAFGARLRDELDLEALGADLSGVVRDTVQPAHVSLWLRR
jgi:hypothetical protein